ncbi:MAG: diguanylate cyclase, partial [Lachnospiraceae bacterium]|nr:diguanylate cyclase [Lachnospiraceae bacterium]
AELKESVSSLLTNMPAMTFSKDVATGKYLACNQYFADYAHKETPEGVMGLTDFEIFDRQTAEHFVEDDKKALAMDKPYIFFEDVPDAAGNQRKFQTTKLKFVDDAGRQCLLGLCQDVTDAMRIRREFTEKLAQARSEANLDALTGVKNKHAYQAAEESLNRRIRAKDTDGFAVTILDVNDLKRINDTEGHQAGDTYIRQACGVICRIFDNSPVFRVGGDEFAVLSQGQDYERIDDLVNEVAAHNVRALCTGGVVIACGMARYEDEDDVASVFARADQDMYENKSRLKMRGEPAGEIS